LEREVDRRAAQQAAEEPEQLELRAPPPVECGDPDVEEVLPEGDVAGLDPDQLRERLRGPPPRHAAQRAVEGEVEELVEDQARAELRVSRGAASPSFRSYPERRRPRRRPARAPAAEPPAAQRAGGITSSCARITASARAASETRRSM